MDYGHSPVVELWGDERPALKFAAIRIGEHQVDGDHL